jgi:hypothetical protein
VKATSSAFAYFSETTRTTKLLLITSTAGTIDVSMGLLPIVVRATA